MPRNGTTNFKLMPSLIPMNAQNRPISPHLQIYRPQLTSVLSITHRATGVALAVGTLLLSYWLIALAGGPESYAAAQSLINSVLGQLVLVAFTFAVFYHLCNGIRHLFWDAGYGFELETAYASGRAVIVVSILLTFVCWAISLAGGM